MNYTEIGTMMKKAALYDEMVKKAAPTSTANSKSPAGIGGTGANASMRRGSYTASLVNNSGLNRGDIDTAKNSVYRGPAKTTGMATPAQVFLIFGNKKLPYLPITNEQLSKARESQATYNAGRLFPYNSVPFDTVHKGLIDQGAANLKQYKETGTVKGAPEVWRNNEKFMKVYNNLSPQDQKALLLALRMQASNNTNRFGSYT